MPDDAFLNAIRARLGGGVPMGAPRLEPIPDPTSFNPLSQAGFTSRIGNYGTQVFRPSPIDTFGENRPLLAPAGPGALGPLPEVSLQPGDPNSPGRVSSGMGSNLRIPVGTDEVTDQVTNLRKLLGAGVGGVKAPNEDLANVGMNFIHGASGDAAAAKRAEGTIQSEGLTELAAIGRGKARIYEQAEPVEKAASEGLTAALEEGKQKQEEDREWLRTHSRVDPYRTFRTNAGAGILALLGAGLMATGAGLRRDASLDWTKQIDNMLNREADEQMRLIDNKKWSVTEAGQNMKRLVETSKDEYEARSRFRMQGLNALQERAEAIKNTTESKAVKERAEGAIAEIQKKLGEEVVNLAIRREGMRSQEGIAQLQANVATRGQDVGFATGAAANFTQAQAAQRQAEFARSKPVTERYNKLEEEYETAHTAAQNFYDVLRDKDANDDAKNSAAAAFIDSYGKFIGGGTGTAGVRGEALKWGLTLNPKSLLAKTNRYTAQDVAKTMLRLDQIRADKINHLYSGKWLYANPAAGSVYSQR